jgi:hypothetical protein
MMLFQCKVWAETNILQKPVVFLHHENRCSKTVDSIKLHGLEPQTPAMFILSSVRTPKLMLKDYYMAFSPCHCSGG